MFKMDHAGGTFLLVYGLREGSWIRVHGTSMELKGLHSARWFRKDKDPEEANVVVI